MYAASRINRTMDLLLRMAAQTQSTGDVLCVARMVDRTSVLHLGVAGSTDRTAVLPTCVACRTNRAMTLLRLLTTQNRTRSLSLVVASMADRTSDIAVCVASMAGRAAAMSLGVAHIPDRTAEPRLLYSCARPAALIEQGFGANCWHSIKVDAGCMLVCGPRGGQHIGSIFRCGPQYG